MTMASIVFFVSEQIVSSGGGGGGSSSSSGKYVLVVITLVLTGVQGKSLTGIGHVDGCVAGRFAAKFTASVRD